MNARIIAKAKPTAAVVDATVKEDAFLSLKEMVPVKRDQAERACRLTLTEIEELTRENRWDDVVALWHPLEEKAPELVEHQLDVRVRQKVAFALGQVQRFDDAISELKKCLTAEPDSFFHHSSLAYTAYNSLYAAKNREIILNGSQRRERIETAHRHFRAAQNLRPDGVTNFYRQGMLFKQIEGRSDKGLPLFSQAVTNWDGLSPEVREERHQERKNFIKSLYQLASSLIERGHAAESLERMKRCLSEDEKSNHLSLLYKYFALGKIHFHLNQMKEARDALRFSLQCTGGQPSVFVCELLARTYLAMGNLSRAREIIEKVPAARRRPYYQWTEADIFCAAGEFGAARSVLKHCQERDRRSRHKALIRLARIDYLHQQYREGLAYAEEAERFFQEKWGNACQDALFWRALCHYRLGNVNAALEAAEELNKRNAFYPKLSSLLAELKSCGDARKN